MQGELEGFLENEVDCVFCLTAGGNESSAVAKWEAYEKCLLSVPLYNLQRTSGALSGTKTLSAKKIIRLKFQPLMLW